VTARDDSGHVTDQKQLSLPGNEVVGGPCIFRFRVFIGDPSNLKSSYQITVGTHPPRIYSVQALKGSDWNISIDVSASRS
jgi:hypothetical protein